jgi:hypothetical protein
MPTFTQYTEVEVEIDEFVDNLYSHEIEELINYLKQEGHLGEVTSHEMNIQDIEWSKVTDKLSQSRLQLTLEEEELIKNIVSRL